MSLGIRALQVGRWEKNSSDCLSLLVLPSLSSSPVCCCYRCYYYSPLPCCSPFQLLRPPPLPPASNGEPSTSRRDLLCDRPCAISLLPSSLRIVTSPTFSTLGAPLAGLACHIDSGFSGLFADKVSFFTTHSRNCSLLHYTSRYTTRYLSCYLQHNTLPSESSPPTVSSVLSSCRKLCFPQYGRKPPSFHPTAAFLLRKRARLRGSSRKQRAQCHGHGTPSTTSRCYTCQQQSRPQSSHTWERLGGRSRSQSCPRAEQKSIVCGWPGSSSDRRRFEADFRNNGPCRQRKDHSRQKCEDFAMNSLGAR